uniref:Hypothetical conserved protein n=1 Tax=uncultured Planctomycetota bacterium TaxID=120965 RepID=H5SCA5_9BACT|nr:hypothetical conserved protein [uncultured Planctomycetota bacterium]
MSVYLGPLVDDQGHRLSYTVTGQPEGVDLVYITEATDPQTGDSDVNGSDASNPPGAYLQGYIAYSNIASNGPPRDFVVNVETRAFTTTIIWTISDTNRLEGTIGDFSGNEGDTVDIVLPRPQSAPDNVSWFVVTGLPPGLVYDYYYGAILGRIDYTAVTEVERVKDFQVMVEFHEADVVDRVTFTMTVANVNPPPGDNGVGIVIYRTKELEATVLFDEQGLVLHVTSTPFVVALNKSPESPITLTIRSRPGSAGLPVLFRVYNDGYSAGETTWSPELVITLDGSTWDSGVIIESTVDLSNNPGLVAEDTVPIEINPDPHCGIIPGVVRFINLYLALLPATDQRYWRGMANNLKQDAVFLKDIRAVPVANGNNDVQVAWGIARAHNRSITARYALAFTNLTRPAMPENEDDPPRFNAKMAWFGLAAFASDLAGKAMHQLATVEPPGAAGFERGAIVRFINYLARGNQGVYEDIYWQALAYYFGGLGTVLRLDGDRMAWTLADQQRLEGAMHWFLHREQTQIIQPIYDEIMKLRILAQTSAFFFGLICAATVRWAFQTLDNSLSVSLWVSQGKIPAPPSAPFSEILEAISKRVEMG